MSNYKACVSVCECGAYLILCLHSTLLLVSPIRSMEVWLTPHPTFFNRAKLESSTVTISSQRSVLRPEDWERECY